jgi:hypothetical protein
MANDQQNPKNPSPKSWLLSFGHLLVIGAWPFTTAKRISLCNPAIPTHFILKRPAGRKLRESSFFELELSLRLWHPVRFRGVSLCSG